MPFALANTVLELGEEDLDADILGCFSSSFFPSLVVWVALLSVSHLSELHKTPAI